MFKKQYLKTKKQIWNYKIDRYRSSRSEVFCKKGVFKNVTKFTRKHLYQRFFFNKVAMQRERSHELNFDVLKM